MCPLSLSASGSIRGMWLDVARAVRIVARTARHPRISRMAVVVDVPLGVGHVDVVPVGVGRLVPMP